MNIEGFRYLGMTDAALMRRRPAASHVTSRHCLARTSVTGNSQDENSFSTLKLAQLWIGCANLPARRAFEFIQQPRENHLESHTARLESKETMTTPNAN